jgi:hypothetical protein
MPTAATVLMWITLIVIVIIAAIFLIALIAAVMIFIEDATDRYRMRHARIPAKPFSRFDLPPPQDK